MPIRDGLAELILDRLRSFHAETMGDYNGDPWSEHPYQDAHKSWFFKDNAVRLAAAITAEFDVIQKVEAGPNDWRRGFGVTDPGLLADPPKGDPGALY
jgi:hypothetical protein